MALFVALGGVATAPLRAEPADAPGPVVADEPSPAAALAEVRSVRPDIGGAVSLRRVEIELGPGVLEIDQGILVPARTDRGTVLELVFVGQARLRLSAPDEIESGQLELFTGDRSLDAPVEEAVLVLTGEDALRALLAHDPPREIRPELERRIEKLYERWRDGPERRRIGVESSLFKAQVGDRAFHDYFAVWFHSFELGEFVLQLDPEDDEPITLAGFQPLELSGWERARLRHQIRVEQRKDRWLGLRLEDLGTWDIWLSSAWDPADGGEFPGNTGFEAEHYSLDVKLRKRKAWLEGRARLELRAQSSGRRVARLNLGGDLVVESVTDAKGRELFFFRSGDEVVVSLPRPSVAGETLVLDVTYDGRALRWVRGGLFDLDESDGWYPHCGSVDRATYDVTLRWPKRREIVSGGRLVAAGREGDYRWERRVVDAPAIGYSFVFGEFDTFRRRVGRVDVTLAFARDPKFTPEPRLRSEMLDTVADALEYLQSVFGPYPLDELTLVTVPRSYSQSYLGYITLAESMLRQPDPYSASARWRRATTISHEIAHQWWGNLVGWHSYRDQWLSEGMANYSALLYDSHRDAAGPDRLALMSAGWRNSLALTTLDGRTIESLGPIVLGNRLNSSRAETAYRTIVYRKGAVVLAMLARAVGEERFLPMLRSLVEAASGRVLTTADFLDAIERMSGLDLEGFALQFVYGTGIPEVYYDYDLLPEDGGRWVVEGDARLLTAPRYGFRIVPAAGGGWEVERTPGPRSGSNATTLVVPYHITLDKPDKHPAHGGQLFLQGRHDHFRIETDHEPVALELDPGGEILAWFYSEERHPKRVMRYAAEDLAIEGRWDEAEARYERALRLPADTLSTVDPLAPPPAVPLIDSRLEDLKIRLAVVRLHLGRGMLDRVPGELDEIDAGLDGNDSDLLRMERDVLRARADMLGGDFAEAQRRLKKTLRIATPVHEHRNWRDLLLQMQLNAERSAIAEAYALLLVAATEAGHAEDADWARHEARDRGVDLSLFVGPGE